MEGPVANTPFILLILGEKRFGHQGRGTFETNSILRGKDRQMDAESSYNDIPYRASLISHTHPERLAVIARLMGLPTPELRDCRVLELGCAEGTNLMSMAQGLPDAEFVGIDLSSRQIEDGNKLLKKLGISNVKLLELDIMDLDTSYGGFDFVICHGVFSWVPEFVRTRVLELCRDLLSEHGLAFISYNTLPGWYLARGMRDLLCFHTRGESTPAAQMKSARELLTAINEQPASSKKTYEHHLRVSARRLLEQPDAYVFHEYMEAENNALYFGDFVKMLEPYGLSYVGDAELDDMDRLDPKGKVEALLERQATNWVDLQQGKDMADGTMFRRSVICRSGSPSRPIDTARVNDLLLASAARAQGKNDRGETKLVSQTGETMETSSELVIALFRLLAEAWPERLGVDNVTDKLASQFSKDPDEIRGGICALAVRCFPGGMIRLNLINPPLGKAGDPRPCINPLSRQDLEEQKTEVTSLFHRLVKVSDLGVILYPLLDGINTVDEILLKMIQKAQAGELKIERDGTPIRDEQELARMLVPALKAELRRAHDMGLLVQHD